MSETMTVGKLKEFLETYNPADDTEILIARPDKGAKSITWVSCEQVQKISDGTQSWVVMFRTGLIK